MTKKTTDETVKTPPPIGQATIYHMYDRVMELVKSTGSDLENVQRKIAMAFNIALIEEISRRVSDLVLFPKVIGELSELLKASGELAVAMKETKAIGAPRGSNTLIEGINGNGAEHSADPLADSLEAWRRARNGNNALKTVP